MNFRNLAALTLFALPFAAHASDLLNDNFDSESPDLNYTGFVNWNVLGGTVDIHGSGSPWGNGQQKYAADRFVDLDGSNGQNGVMETKSNLLVSAGQTLAISYDLNLNPGSPYNSDNGIRVELGRGGAFTNVLTHDEFVPNPLGTWRHVELMYTATAADANDGLKMRMSGLGAADWQGVFVDNVRVQSVPEPCSMAALGVGALGLLRRRAKRA